jgi:hypothetical protein
LKLWKNPVEKTKVYRYTGQNSLKPGGKNKKKHHDIYAIPMLRDPLRIS